MQKIQSKILLITAIGTLCIILYAVFAPTILRIYETPPGQTYLLGSGYLPDYYQYLTWIKSGMEGNILLSSRLSDVANPSVLMHPLFIKTGWMARVLNVSPYDALLALRIVATIVFFIALHLLAKKILIKTSARILYCAILLSAGSFYTKTNGLHSEPIPWITSFNVIGKFTLPPHHLFALVCVIAIIALISGTKKRNLSIIISALLAVSIGLLNPSILLALFLLLGPEIVLSIIAMQKTKSFRFPPQLIVFFASLPILFYNQYLFATTDPWKLMYELMKGFRPPVVFTDYILSLGVILPLALLSLPEPKTWKTARIRMLVWWGFLPFALFPLIGTLLPMNESRLFQLYQYIPLSILAARGVWLSVHALIALVHLRPVFEKVILFAVGSLCLWYSWGIFMQTYSSSRAEARGAWNNYALYITTDMKKTFEFLDGQKNDDVVVAGETVSLLTASLTPHRVLLGRDDTVRNYYTRRAEIFDFVNGKLDKAQVMDFLIKYHVRYTIFGIDTYSWSSVPYESYGLTKNTTNIGSITIVEWKTD